MLIVFTLGSILLTFILLTPLTAGQDRLSIAILTVTTFIGILLYIGGFILALKALQKARQQVVQGEYVVS